MGIAVGKCWNDSYWEAQYEGIAPGARLAFVDLGITTSADEIVRVPFNLTQEVYDVIKIAGSIAHIDAWGGKLFL